MPDIARSGSARRPASRAASAPAATIRILGFSTLEDGTVRIEFSVG